MMEEPLTTRVASVLQQRQEEQAAAIAARARAVERAAFDRPPRRRWCGGLAQSPRRGGCRTCSLEWLLPAPRVRRCCRASRRRRASPTSPTSRRRRSRSGRPCSASRSVSASLWRRQQATVEEMQGPWTTSSSSSFPPYRRSPRCTSVRPSLGGVRSPPPAVAAPAAASKIGSSSTANTGTSRPRPGARAQMARRAVRLLPDAPPPGAPNPVAPAAAKRPPPRRRARRRGGGAAASKLMGRAGGAGGVLPRKAVRRQLTDGGRRASPSSSSSSNSSSSSTRSISSIIIIISSHRRRWRRSREGITPISMRWHPGGAPRRSRPWRERTLSSSECTQHLRRRHSSSTICDEPQESAGIYTQSFLIIKQIKYQIRITTRSAPPQ